MRIQHNITAMNSYRNFNNNAGALSKNLEKLSSGYRINRAGDDAAGLAISEKMRAQIAGLGAAQRNVKDGISLVKTAEGALQEVQDMMNRMKSLATQSANGTFDNTVDRANLQKEVNALKKEIDRIADSANFNGQKLLDGSLTKEGTTSIEVNGAESLASVAGKAGKFTATGKVIDTAAVKGLNEGDSINITLGTNQGHNYNISLTRKGNTLVDAYGNTFSLTATTGGLAPTAGEVSDAIQGAVRSATGGAFKVSSNAGVLTFESVEKGSRADYITAMGANKKTFADGKVTDINVGAQKVTKPEAEKITVGGKAGLAANATKDTVRKAIFDINGQKFVLVAKDSGVKNAQKMAGSNVTVLVGSKLGAVAKQLGQLTGLDIAATSKGSKINISTASGKELNLQIGDTAHNYNQMGVGIDDMHAAALGVGGLDISTVQGAQQAIETITDAINRVSATRGDLGAIQNRLEHTQKNLSVMEENIQDAEATIRDTDVADEMTKYTKNNILLQSAQAMLAQANQMPQGVLQLLQ